MVELPPPFVLNVGVVKPPAVRLNAAIVMPPRMSPLPPPLRINLPSPSTMMMPLKSVLPRIVNVPVTTRNPEPLVSVQSPSTNVNLPLVVESAIVLGPVNKRLSDFALSCKPWRYARALSAESRNEGVSTVPGVVSSSPKIPISGSTTVSCFTIPKLTASLSHGETAKAGRCGSTPAWSTPEYHFAPLLTESNEIPEQSSAPFTVKPAGDSNSRFALLIISSRRFSEPCGPKPYDLSNNRFGSGEVTLEGMLVVVGDTLYLRASTALPSARLSAYFVPSAFT